MYILHIGNQKYQVKAAGVSDQIYLNSVIRAVGFIKAADRTQPVCQASTRRDSGICIYRQVTYTTLYSTLIYSNSILPSILSQLYST